MTKTRLVVAVLMSLSLALPVFGKTYKSTYSVPCGEVWGGVKDTLSNPDNYTVVDSNDANMTATYKVKHAVHVTITRDGPPAKEQGHLGTARANV